MGRLRSPPTAFAFPGPSFAFRLNLLVELSSPTSPLKKGLKLIWSVVCYRPPSLSLLSQILFVLQSPGQDTRTLPSRKGATQILNFWGAFLEPHLGALRIFNLDNEQEQVLAEKFPCMALYGHSTSIIVKGTVSICWLDLRWTLSPILCLYTYIAVSPAPLFVKSKSELFLPVNVWKDAQGHSRLEKCKSVKQGDTIFPFIRSSKIKVWWHQCSWKYKETGMLTHCWWEGRLGWNFWRAIWQSVSNF